MLDPFALLFDEFCDRAVFGGRFEQFDLRLADFQKCGAYFLGRHFLDVVAFGAEQFFPERNGRVEAFDCNPQVFDV